MYSRQITINYATGENWESSESDNEETEEQTYIINENTEKFHEPTVPVWRTSKRKIKESSRARGTS